MYHTITNFIEKAKLDKLLDPLDRDLFNKSITSSITIR